MSNPYRTPDSVEPVEPALYLRNGDEIAFWDKAFFAFIKSPREWDTCTPHDFADNAVRARRERMG